MLTIQDYEVSWASGVQRPVSGVPLVVRVRYLEQPLFQSDGVAYREDQTDERRFAVDGTTGGETITLLWPSERKPGDALCQIIRAKGTIYQGLVPEGATGPLTFNDLLTLYGAATLYGWQVVSAGQVPAQPVAVQQVTVLSSGPIPVSVWTDQTAFLSGQLVIWRGALYQALAPIPAGGTPPTSADGTSWLLLSLNNGLRGRGFAWGTTFI